MQQFQQFQIQLEIQLQWLVINTQLQIEKETVVQNFGAIVFLLIKQRKDIMYKNYKLGTSYYFGFVKDFENRMNLIKKNDFDSILISTDERYYDENGSPLKIAKLAKKYGIDIEQVHSSYYGMTQESIWFEGNGGRNYIKSLKRDVDICHDCHSTKLVVHVSDDPTISHVTKVGIRRLKDLTEYAEKKNVKIAIENIYSCNLICEILDKISNKNLGVCFDVGHAHTFFDIGRNDDNFILLEKYKDRILCFHIHDNDGLSDEHKTVGEGTIDWNRFASLIEGLDVTLTSEAMNPSASNVKKATKEISDGLKSIVDKIVKKND